MAEHAKVVTVIEITLHKLGSEAYDISVEIPDSLDVTGCKLLACNVCSFTFFHNIFGHIFQCCLWVEAQLWVDTTETLS